MKMAVSGKSLSWSLLSGFSDILPLPALVILSLIFQKAGARNLLTITSGCACPGHNITLQCTVISTSGGSSTVWRGSFFNCPSKNNEIAFRHSQFIAGATETCKNGSILGQSLSSDIDNGRFTSQLSIQVSPDIVGQNLTCEHDNGSRRVPVGSIKLSATTFPSATNISYVLARFEQSATLTFTWNILALGCSAIHYNILASNCGSCPTTTNHTTVTCTDVPIDGSKCTFVVQTVICRITIGSMSVMLPSLDNDSTMDCLGTVISTSVLGILLILCLTVSLTVIVILVIAKLKIRTELTVANNTIAVMNCRSSKSSTLKYHDVDTSENIAYSRSSELTVTQKHHAHDVDTSGNIAYLRSSGLLPKQHDVDTSDNVAYSRSSGLLPKQHDVDTSDNVAYGLHVID